MLLQLEQVSKTFTGKPEPVQAVHEVSLALDAGEFVAIQGASGSGKSTLLLIAGTLLAPDAGNVMLAGDAPYQLSPNQRAGLRSRLIGFVFQQFHLIPYLSVLENVLAAGLPCIGRPGMPSEETVRKEAIASLQRLGLSTRLGHTPAELSSGERQRCALARALLNRPQLLLADEPTGNLDRENAQIVMQTLRQFADDGGAVLLVTHDAQAAAMADRTVHMENGRLFRQIDAVKVEYASPAPTENVVNS